jgi:hypothetical protein
MQDEKLIEKIRKELISLQNKIDECYEKREKLVEDYTRKLLNFQVVDLEGKPEPITKKSLTP